MQFGRARTVAQLRAVSVRHGGLRAVGAVGGQPEVPWAGTSFFPIEDPMETGLDLGRYLNARTVTVLQGELWRAENMLSLAGMSLLSDRVSNLQGMTAIYVLNGICEEKQEELFTTW